MRAAATSASTRIEGNQLSLRDADALLGGSRVDAHERDIREVRNYAAALDLVADIVSRGSFEWQELALQQLNASVMRGLPHDTRGQYRAGPVTVGGGFYSAPNAASVAALTGSLLGWARETDTHPLVRAALLHLNLVAIHPWFDGNGRTTRIACLLDLSPVAPRPGWVDIEPLLAADQEGYFRRIRDALGMSWDPQNHVVGEWVEWYAGLHVTALRHALELEEAERRDVMVILAALEERGEDPAWGPLILTSAYGAFTVGMVSRSYDLSSSALRAMIGRLVEAGWLEQQGRTRGRTYRPSSRVDALGLASPVLARAGADRRTDLT